MTTRQEQILVSIIEQFAEIAVPVGSITLAKLFGVSPATIRAEMVDLEELGFLTQPHTSSGRIPTDKGYRFYVNLIQGEEVLQISIKNSAVTPKEHSKVESTKRVSPKLLLKMPLTHWLNLPKTLVLPPLETIFI